MTFADFHMHRQKLGITLSKTKNVNYKKHPLILLKDYFFRTIFDIENFGIFESGKVKKIFLLIHFQKLYRWLRSCYDSYCIEIKSRVLFQQQNLIQIKSDEIN